MPKGRAAERYVKERIEACGYEVHHPAKAKFREQDIFGEWDLLGFGHGRLLACQVKGSEYAQGINQWFMDNRPYEEHIDDLRLAFIHVDGDDIRMAYSAPDGYDWVLNEQDDGTTLPDNLDVVLA